MTARNRAARLYVGLTYVGTGSVTREVPADAYTVTAAQPGRPLSIDSDQAIVSPGETSRIFLSALTRPWREEADKLPGNVVPPPAWVGRSTCPDALSIDQPILCTAGAFWDLNPARASFIATSRAVVELAKSAAGTKHSGLYLGFEARPEDGTEEARRQKSDTLMESAARTLMKALVYPAVAGIWVAPDGTTWVSASVEKNWADKVAKTAPDLPDGTRIGEKVPRPRSSFTARAVGVGDVIAFGTTGTALMASAELAALLTALHYLAADRDGTKVDHSCADSTQNVAAAEATTETIQFTESVSRLTTTAGFSSRDTTLTLKSVCKDYAASHLRKAQGSKWTLDEAQVEYSIEVTLDHAGRTATLSVANGIPILPAGTSAGAALHDLKQALTILGVKIESRRSLPPINGAPLVEVALSFSQ